MLFDFTEDQRGYAEAVHGRLGRQVTPAALRAAWDAGHDHGDAAWPAVVELGLPGLVVPEDRGGAGGTLVDLALPLEACGYHCVPGPLVATLVVVPLVLTRHGRGPHAEQWLARVVDGSALAALALGGGASDGASDGAGSGDGELVPDGAVADVVLVRRGVQLHLVPQERVVAERLASTDPTRRLARCTAEVGDDTLVTDDPRAAALALDLSAAATASLLVGLGQHLLDTTRDHLLQREQFGVRIGTFQALKHRLADVAVALEAARSLCWSAAYRLAVDDPEASLSASLAKGAAGHAAHLANAAALQLHGGIGFTWEHDLHLWLQRGQALEQAFGTTADHRVRAAEHALARTPSTAR